VLDESRELGALRPLGVSPKDDDDPVPDDFFVAEVVPVSDDPDFSDFEELFDAEVVPISDELDFSDFDELFDAFSEDPDEEEADSTPSDFAVSESIRPVAFMLLAP
jgi:hypothetical protein